MGEFTENFCLNSGITIKQEPLLEDTSNINISASVPIPLRRDVGDYRDFGIEESSQSPLYSDIRLTGLVQTAETPDYCTFWENRMVNGEEILKSEVLIHMDDEDNDIFQVDKADLFQDPTLAALNATDVSLLDDLNFDDLLLPEENKYNNLDRVYLQKNNSSINNNNNSTIIAASFPPHAIIHYKESEFPLTVSNRSFETYSPKTNISALSPVSQTSSNSSLLHSGSSPLHTTTLPQRHSTLHELLQKQEPYSSPDQAILGQSVPDQNSSSSPLNVNYQRSHISRLSSSAPSHTHLGMDQIWQRREPRRHLTSTSSLAEAGSTSSISTGGILSPDPLDFSNDEVESDEDSDGHYEDFSSDNGSDDEDDGNKHSSKKERYFWQYNVQAKGPKGQRLVMKCKMEDPHVLHEVTDPVFSPDCSVRGIKHSGKARKGDGNDLTPNARKLYNIGKELDKLGQTINDMTPVSELPFTIRPTSRKEKNKLASRACRLKKKAQHEANKIKLSGLETEHKRLIGGIIQAKQILANKLKEEMLEKQTELTQNMEKVSKNCSKVKIAGNTTDYVNKVLERLKSGASATSAITEDL